MVGDLLVADDVGETVGAEQDDITGRDLAGSRVRLKAERLAQVSRDRVRTRAGSGLFRGDKPYFDEFRGLAMVLGGLLEHAVAVQVAA